MIKPILTCSCSMDSISGKTLISPSDSTTMLKTFCPMISLSKLRLSAHTHVKSSQTSILAFLVRILSFIQATSANGLASKFAKKLTNDILMPALANIFGQLLYLPQLVQTFQPPRSQGYSFVPLAANIFYTCPYWRLRIFAFCGSNLFPIAKTNHLPRDIIASYGIYPPSTAHIHFRQQTCPPFMAHTHFLRQPNQPPTAYIAFHSKHTSISWHNASMAHKSPSTGSLSIENIFASYDVKPRMAQIAFHGTYPPLTAQSPTTTHIRLSRHNLPFTKNLLLWHIIASTANKAIYSKQTHHP